MTLTTIKEYIEASMYNYPTLYKTGFDVLEQLFATLGNGIELDEDGYLRHYEPHPNSIDQPFEHIYEKERAMGMTCGLDAFEMMQGIGKDVGTREDKIADIEEDARNLAKFALTYPERLMTVPTCTTLYSWSDTEKFQPFRKYVGCKCPDFKEYVEYFCRIIEEARDEDITPQNYMGDRYSVWFKYDNETARYKASLQDWKANVDLVRKVLL